MMVLTSTGDYLDSTEICKYFNSLINRFFKILPMRENNEQSLQRYMFSLQRELIGCQKFFPDLEACDPFISLLSNLQYLIDDPNGPVPEVKSAVFRSINICTRLCERFADEEVLSK